MPAERVVEVLWKQERGYYTNARTPAILHVCSEAHHEALKQYTAIVLENHRHQPLSFGTYLNYSKDKLYLFMENNDPVAKVYLMSNFLRRLAPEVASSLQYIIVDNASFCTLASNRAISGFRNLRHLLSFLMIHVYRGLTILITTRSLIELYSALRYALQSLSLREVFLGLVAKNINVG